MAFFLSLVVDGALAGLVYALVALAFVIVFKASRMINFALGEWVMLGTLLVAFGFGSLGLGAIGSLGLASAGMIGLALAFNGLVLQRLVGRPLIALVMVTLGLSALLRGAIAIAFGDTPRALPFALPQGTLDVLGASISAGRLATGVVAAGTIALIAWAYRTSRTGLALRAMTDDEQAALASGIDIGRHMALTWGLAGLVSVLAGILWTLSTGGGGLGLQLLGLKVFPIVVIGGLDSIAGTIVAALIVGIVESLAAGYLGAQLGYGIGGIVASALLLVVLLIRPYGLFGRAKVERV